MKILVTGAGGQLGTVLTKSLKEKYGKEAVIASDIRTIANYSGIFEILDATSEIDLANIVVKHKVTQIYHLAAILSANGEKNPIQTWDINLKSLFSVLEVSVKHKLDKVFFPSSIAVYGLSAPKIDTKQDAYLDPTTVYGISKAAGENWAQYYFLRYGLDVRSIRYPGVIGYQSLPGGGTTDYAVDIYHKAIKKEDFTCYLKEEACLPMIYIDDAIRATLELMQAPKEAVKIRTSYNLAGVSFTPAEIADSIKEWYPDFKVSYKPDFRQAIADSWPKSINDDAAREDWGWKPNYSLKEMTKEMIIQLKKQ
ncbi:NAD-dependent epimerase/dehydratase family protein [Tenacibaculum finnmarkense genomovar finnmarkense]|uniref:NAD-dependent epimerase/dehydratase family protein n=1 Tax=Tenacibaculum finnmarkense TaxID=2781243 RepID=UPI001E34B581|nr:NAD-dependent epimerase/dehydratase family protein [Tenacibaculum finnmarkense]MCD8417584.1 NAD-dependent epimerase/dehydratase family protein [Tenacibaculum finnmarkense genomovar finnmarkense]MCG8185977.1 NAD-dependent epimerase/dehydratase family protein [Tenacibaculum finnmarkense genomovar finnmarkense]MCG8202523.1 NAD-dependent epimerase/dehydratase family protein [Tenacibaculum finnmarkense genomovar finnmarkense]MCG8209818.1 NAD-dependent epimerase/dehydratase family protein [Tenacib